MHGQTRIHQYMMDVGFVWLEYTVPCYAALQSNSDNVKDRNEQERNGDQHLLLATILRSNRTHQALDTHIGTDIAKEEAPCIAHKNLQSSNLSEDIEAPEYDQRTDYRSIQRSNG